MAKTTRQFVVTLTEEEAKGLLSLLSQGVDYAVKSELKIAEVEYSLSDSVGWFSKPEFLVKAQLPESS